MTIDQLKYFLEAARFQHINKAAKSLHISASSISAAVAALEAEYQCKLFERLGRGIILTSQGRYLQAQAESILDQLMSIERRLNEKAENLVGNYRLGGSHFLAMKYLGQAWISLQEEHPALSGELRSLSTATTLAELLSGQLDLGLCFSPQLHPSLKYYELAGGTLRIAVRKDHPILNNLSQLKLSSLNDFPAVLHKSAPGIEICETHPMFDKFQIKPTISNLFDNDEFALDVLKQTNAWSLLPDIVISSQASSLVVLPIPSGWVAPYSICLVIRPHRQDNVAFKLLQNILLRKFSGKSKWRLSEA